ncbi:PIG-L deacetylase family protein [Rhodohalobacter sulfatireducens]|uniref:PIG-L family deacetylase n=1 Tax=Rhodohalobacter sulfatireducens TaxID=2911366 RepID=A0ABS9KE43_9BACT|nr:PIG-L deacetylase family protein [Rhodohalobacter sulfatireducens]MCG2589129.1 PIG-L family deacetylase [Rhodohalobacter sulfatireducens]
MKHLILFITFFCLFTTAVQSQINSPDDDPLRVIAIFAHPDDADFKMAGTAIQMAQAGHQVKYLSITNGNAGHHEMGGGVLAKRRRAEAKEAAIRTGIAEYEVWDYDDAKLMPTLDIRMEVIRAIREWNADVVLGLRPNDYHPDHRNAGKLVIDASYMVIVPNVVSDTPPLENNPVFLYMQDGFTKPNPFSHDIVVSIDDSFELKAQGLDAHVSQVYEWMPWTMGMLDEVPVGEDERYEWLKSVYLGRGVSDAQRAGLEKWYGAEEASEVEHAESFEIAEYGHYPTDEEIRMIFPMLD